MEPLRYWRGNDSPDRQGITEIRHVEGYLAYWDELAAGIPTCPSTPAPAAAGGTTWRRSAGRCRCCAATTASSRPARKGTPTAWRSWIPYYGTGVRRHDRLRGPQPLVPLLGHRPPPSSAARASTGQVPPADGTSGAKRREYLSGDYYPLTPYSLDNSAWMAWQFDRPEQGRGMIQAFRRGESPYESARFSLHGLEPDARYVISNIDSGQSRKMTGRELTAPGLSVDGADTARAPSCCFTKRNDENSGCWPLAGSGPGRPPRRWPGRVHRWPWP